MKLKLHSQRDCVAGCLFVLIGASFAFGALNYTFGSSMRPGPGYFPRVLGLVLVCLGVLLVVESVVKRVPVEGERIGSIAWRPLSVIVAALTLFGFLLPRVGLFIALPLLVLLSGFASSESRLPTTLISAVVLTLGSWLVFVVGLGLTIPLWPNFIGT